MFWLGYFVFDFFQSRSLIAFNTREHFADWVPLVVALVDPWPKVILFYLLFFLVLRPALRKPGGLGWRFALRSVLLTGGAVILMRAVNLYILFPQVYRYQITSIPFFRPSAMFATLVDVLVPVAVLLIIELLIYNNSVRRSQAALEKARLNTELQYLRAQVNPHFLFNVLSSIHALTVDKAPDAAQVTLRLSKLMRFMLFGVQRKRIPIDDELRFIDDYVELQKMRFGSKLTVESHFSIDNEYESIAPLLLLPLVENAFKHGGIEESEFASISIDLQLNGGALQLQVKNKVAEVASGSTSGIGLTNLRRQLELTYPTYKLTINRANDQYNACLTLNLHDYAEDPVHID